MILIKSCSSSISGKSLSRERIAEAQIVISVFLAGITFVIDRFAMINGLGLYISIFYFFIRFLCKFMSITSSCHVQRLEIYYIEFFLALM